MLIWGSPAPVRSGRPAARWRPGCSAAHWLAGRWRAGWRGGYRSQARGHGWMSHLSLLSLSWAGRHGCRRWHHSTPRPRARTATTSHSERDPDISPLRHLPSRLAPGSPRRKPVRISTRTPCRGMIATNPSRCSAHSALPTRSLLLPSSAAKIPCRRLDHIVPTAAPIEPAARRAGPRAAGTPSLPGGR